MRLSRFVMIVCVQSVLKIGDTEFIHK